MDGEPWRASTGGRTGATGPGGISRELHDVIGHSISVMGVQAGAVRSVLHHDQVREREALLAVERTGRQAVSEMRRLIGLLRTADEASDGPVPSLARLKQLVADLRDAGLAANLSMHGDLHSLSPGVDLAGYRIIQEALTNVLKRAPGATVGATVCCSERELVIEVTDDGNGGTPPSGISTSGHGLLGMRERVALYGGDLVTGRRPRGGFCSPQHPNRAALMAIRVLLADDQGMVKSGFAMILDAQPDIEVVGEADDGARAVAETARLAPDVVVMDIRMPQLDGVGATRVVTRQAKPPRVLVVTTFDIEEYVYEALRAGASGFMLKNSPPEELVRAVRVVAAGESLLAPTVTPRLIEAFCKQAPLPAASPRELEQLTVREREVLALVAQGLSNNEIAEQLVVGLGTVRTHVGHFLMKLHLRDRVQAVVFAYETGIVTPGHAGQPDHR